MNLNSASFRKIAISALGLLGMNAQVGFDTYPIRGTSFWQSRIDAHRSLRQKFELPIPEVIAEIRRSNRRQNGTGDPDGTKVTAADLDRLYGVLSRFPENILKAIDAKVIYFTVADRIGSSAFSNNIVSAEGYVEGGYIVFDRSVLTEAPNAWATRRENSPFRLAPGYEIRARITESDRNEPNAALEYLMLHEVAHLLSEGTWINPGTGNAPDDRPITDFEFAPISWTVANRAYVGIDDSVFPSRVGLKFYPADADRLDSDRVNRVFTEFGSSSFPTLYAAQNPFEDFAESFANYYHVVLAKRPYESELYRDGVLVRKYGPCWDELRCAKKRKEIETIFGALEDVAGPPKK